MMRVVDIAAGKIILEEAGGMVTDGLGNALESGRQHVAEEGPDWLEWLADMQSCSGS